MANTVFNRLYSQGVKQHQERAERGKVGPDVHYAFKPKIEPYGAGNGSGQKIFERLFSEAQKHKGEQSPTIKYTFKPKITEHSSIATEGKDKTFVRLHTEAQRISEKITQMAKQAEIEEAKKYTHRPVVNTNIATETGRQVFNRLYDTAAERREMIQKMRKQKYHKFKPSLNNIDGVLPRYLEPRTTTPSPTRERESPSPPKSRGRSISPKPPSSTRSPSAKSDKSDNSGVSPRLNNKSPPKLRSISPRPPSGKSPSKSKPKPTPFFWLNEGESEAPEVKVTDIQITETSSSGDTTKLSTEMLTIIEPQRRKSSSPPLNGDYHAYKPNDSNDKSNEKKTKRRASTSPPIVEVTHVRIEEVQDGTPRKSSLSKSNTKRSSNGAIVTNPSTTAISPNSIRPPSIIIRKNSDVGTPSSPTRRNHSSPLTRSTSQLDVSTLEVPPPEFVISPPLSPKAKPAPPVSKVERKSSPALSVQESSLEPSPRSIRSSSPDIVVPASNSYKRRSRGHSTPDIYAYAKDTNSSTETPDTSLSRNSSISSRGDSMRRMSRRQSSVEPVKIDASQLVQDLLSSVSRKTHLDSKVKLDMRIREGDDDAEEISALGEMLLDGPLHFEEGRIVGLRFKCISIAPGSLVTDAHLRFTARHLDPSDFELTIFGELNPNPSTYTSQAFNISSRPKTRHSVKWKATQWNAQEGYNTADLTSIIQEIINQADWTENNSLAFIITATGERDAVSYDEDKNNAPLLHIEYRLPTEREPQKKESNNTTTSTRDRSGSGSRDLTRRRSSSHIQVQRENKEKEAPSVVTSPSASSISDFKPFDLDPPVKPPSRKNSYNIQLRNRTRSLDPYASSIVEQAAEKFRSPNDRRESAPSTPSATPREPERRYSSSQASYSMSRSPPLRERGESLSDTPRRVVWSDTIVNQNEFYPSEPINLTSSFNA